MDFQSLLIFDLDGARFGLDAMRVRECVWLPELTPVEEAPPWIVGIFSLRGRIVPVADLHLRFGHPARRYTADDQVVVLEADHLLMGLIVSEVCAVIELSGDAIQPPPQFDAAPPGPANLITGEARVGDDLVALLDISRLTHLPQAPLPSPPPQAEEGVKIPSLAHSTGDGVETPSLARRTGDGVEAPSLARSAGEGWGGGNGAEHPVPTGLFCPEATPEMRALFHARAMALQEATGEEEGTRLGLAVMELGGEYFGVELAAVQEFCDIAQLSPIPCCPPHILGAMSLRGDLFTLIDPRAALNLPPAARGGKAVVARLGEQAMGIAVDAVHDVVYLRGEELQAPPALRERCGAEITGTAPYAGRMMTVLDLPALLAREEWIVNENV
ncbi:MAG: chemotaxis protein CheW [Deltaproteobacteria bacterium]|nr:chemotaxis protein CheW [Deltaproteobacteria bacterium]